MRRLRNTFFQRIVKQRNERGVRTDAAQFL